MTQCLSHIVALTKTRKFYTQEHDYKQILCKFWNVQTDLEEKELFMAPLASRLMSVTSDHYGHTEKARADFQV
jgi:hypothetical protein